MLRQLVCVKIWERRFTVSGLIMRFNIMTNLKDIPPNMMVIHIEKSEIVGKAISANGRIVR